MAVLCSLAYVVLAVGCAAPIVRSQRLPATVKVPGPVSSHDCQPCESRQRLRDLAPYVAGPFMHGPPGYAAQQAVIQPPHSKFHPVPTRPVFEQRGSYSPPQPIGVQLVPVPEGSFEPATHAPPSIFPDIGLPPITEELPLTPMADDETMALPPPEDA